VARTRRRTAAPGDLYFLPANTGEQLEHAQALHQRAQGDPRARAQLMAEAAEYYAAAGRHETADQLFRDAIADGGDVAGSVHGFYAEFLFTRGRDDEALETIGQARRARPTDPDVFMVIGETLDAHHRHADAAKWLTTGLVRYYGDLAAITADDLDDYDGATLAAARRRARINAGLPEDHLDELARQHLDEDDDQEA
jgi:tetratricopeptide (TPR) repeat protein